MKRTSRHRLRPVTMGAAKVPATGMFAAMLAAAVLAGTATTGMAQTGSARSPSFAPDGRLAFTVAGHIMVAAPDGSDGWSAPVRLSQGPGWDRDPVWTADGRIVFASDRAGTTDLWQIRVTDGPAQVAERLTSGREHDVEPTVSASGVIAFVRGWAGDTDIWLRDADGAERKLTDEPGAEREPAWSPDGDRLAYVAVRSGTRELRVRDMDSGEETVLAAGSQVAAPAWSPDATRLVFASGGGSDAGIAVIDASGGSASLFGTRRGSAAWSPDGAHIVWAEIDGGDGGYNGDPDRLGERLAGDAPVQGRAGGHPEVDGVLGLHVLPAPVVPSPGTRLAIGPTPSFEDAATLALAQYDRVWSRVARLYYGYRGPLASPAHAMIDASGGEAATALEEWRDVGVRHRPAPGTSAHVEDAVWAALRERPARPGARGRAGVSSAHPLASAAGVEILEAGGNVVDAAVAVSFALGVVEPDASGIGGYGEMLIQLATLAEPTAIEFMTRVPEAAVLGNPAVDSLPRSGPGVANPPGTVAGMEMAWRQYGSGMLPWARLLEPAIRLARNGFVLDDGFATTLRRERSRFAEYESSRALFFRDGEPLGVGDTLRNPDLARTLEEIAEGGAAALYTGDLGRRMVEDLRRGGNVMTTSDMRRYLAQEREPIHTTYRGNDVYSGPPPVTGGAVLAGKLNLLEREPVGGPITEDPVTLHRMIEAWRFQPSTGGRIADPDLWPVDVTPFESKDTAAARWRCYDAERASANGALTREDCGRAATADTGDDRGGDDRGDREPEPSDAASSDAAASEMCLADDRDCQATGTTAFVVADAAGNIVSVTQTLGTWGGNFYVSPGLGFLYNDKLRSYGSNPQGYNARIPYARNTTVISPTIVFRGSGAAREPWFGVGAAGNAWITSAVYMAVVGIVDHGLGAQAALELPRFLPGGGGIQIEGGFAPAALRRLEEMGHSFNPISLIGELRMGYGAAVVVEEDGVEAGGDPRRGGTGVATGAAAGSTGR